MSSTVSANTRENIDFEDQLRQTMCRLGFQTDDFLNIKNNGRGEASGALFGRPNQSPLSTVFKQQHGRIVGVVVNSSPNSVQDRSVADDRVVLCWPNSLTGQYCVYSEMSVRDFVAPRNAQMVSSLVGLNNF